MTRDQVITMTIAAQLLGDDPTDAEVAAAVRKAGRLAAHVAATMDVAKMPRDVETWMRVHDREPYQADFNSYWWDGPKSKHILGHEQLPADVWDVMAGGPVFRIEYTTREAAVAALRAALLKLGLILE